MALSTGVEVKVIDESFYIPRTRAPTHDICCYCPDKQNGAGTGTAPEQRRRMQVNLLVTSRQRDLVETSPRTQHFIRIQIIIIHAGELNEYGSQAAYPIIRSK